ncbi:MAG TPA: DUF2092 domain-containing protein, partial [Pirellulales bacterium]|nr:DUF2092 domain-containing protein [Pirellulales bacterium]
MLRNARVAVPVWLTVMMVFSMSPCRAADAPKIDPEAEKVLRAMSGFYAAATKFHVDISATLSVEPKKQSTTIGTSLDFERPNQVAALVAKGDAGLSVLCDGKQLVI